MGRLIEGTLDNIKRGSNPAGHAKMTQLSIDPDQGGVVRVLVPNEDAVGLRYGDRITVELQTQNPLPFGVELGTGGQGRGGAGDENIVIRIIKH